MLANCPIDDICLPVFENIYILIIVLPCLFIYQFLFSEIFIFMEDHIGNNCTIVCFNVSISSVNIYIYIYIYIYI